MTEPRMLLKGERVKLTALTQDDLATIVPWYENTHFLRLLDARPAYPQTEETLKRTSDALTLVRLTGINADKAVSSLTATVNAFDNAMVTTTSSVNKFVAVETKFAVGARDLVEAIGRVGSSAKDAKVGFDEKAAEADIRKASVDLYRTK